MNFLLIDDLRIPGDHRNGKNIPADAVVARNYAEGIRLLQEGCNGEPYDVLYLDHDLGDFTGPHGREITGAAIVEWLREFPQYAPKRDIILVSDNGSGLPYMRSAIKRLYNRPF